jgi:hypothetical protein
MGGKGVSTTDGFAKTCTPRRWFFSVLARVMCRRAYSDSGIALSAQAVYAGGGGAIVAPMSVSVELAGAALLAFEGVLIGAVDLVI